MFDHRQLSQTSTDSDFSPTPQALSKSLTLSGPLFANLGNQIKPSQRWLRGPFWFKSHQTTHPVPRQTFLMYFKYYIQRTKRLLSSWCCWTQLCDTQITASLSAAIVTDLTVFPLCDRRGRLAHFGPFYPNTLLAGACNFSGPVTTEWSDNLIRKVEMKFECYSCLSVTCLGFLEMKYKN